MKELTDQELMQSTPEDQELWRQWVKGLPGLEGFSGTGYDADGVRIPWGSGPHNMKAYREIVEIVKPVSILEIGFNVGYSAVMWLNLCDCTLISTEISCKAETMAAANTIKGRYGERFDILFASSPDVREFVSDDYFDMIFVDGGHLEEDVIADLQLAKDLHIPWIVLDDWIPRFGPGVQVAAKKFPLELVKEFGNTALMKWKSDE